MKNVVLVKGAYLDSAQWNYTDVRVRNSEWPNAHIFGNRYNAQTRISMGKTWYDDPDGYNWYSTLGHESGHYLYGFGDEYMNGNYTKGSSVAWSYRLSHDGDSGEPNEFPKNYGLMDYQYSSHEMSDTTEYYPRANPQADPDLVTHQFYIRPGQSCWTHLKTYYQNDIRQQMSQQGFSDAFFNNLIIPPHVSGSYPGSDRTKRNGPVAMNHDSVTFIDWTPGSSRSTRGKLLETVFDASVSVMNEVGTPVAGAEVWLTSPDRKSFQGTSDKDGMVKCGSLGIGKKLEAYVNGRKAEYTIDTEKESYILMLPVNRMALRGDTSTGMVIFAKPDSSNSRHLNITTSGSLLNSAPTVTLSQSHGYSVSVPMVGSGANQYSGSADCQYDSGILNVSSGPSQSVSPFEIFTTTVGPASGYYAPNAELEMAYTPTSFSGTGSFVMLNSAAPAPPNNGMVQLGNVHSFGFSDSVGSVTNVILKIRLPEGGKGGNLGLYGWDIASKTWIPIPGGTYDPKYFTIALAALNYPAYSLFSTLQAMIRIRRVRYRASLPRPELLSGA
ncbi:MAG: hypothetical protein HC887_08270 [Desulfobacteraceae bacterium]|nr:hypothetical protein [Desulfobacteraceae bacterium]